MTRTDIAISLKPLNWMEDELDNGAPVLSADYDVYNAYIKEENDGTATLTIFYAGELKSEVKRKGLTMEEAKAITREHQVDNACKDFNLDEPTKNAQL
jgi:hypothetical protein|nr:MAG TPA: tify domain [Caudoviricetes sp.]